MSKPQFRRRACPPSNPAKSMSISIHDFPPQVKSSSLFGHLNLRSDFLHSSPGYPKVGMPLSCSPVCRFPQPFVAFGLCLGLEADCVKDSLIGDVPAGASAAKGVDGCARHSNVLTVELADHVHASRVGISGLKVLWLVDLRIHMVSRGYLTGGHADASGGLMGHGEKGTWHHGLGNAAAAAEKYGLSGMDTTTTTAETAASHRHRGGARGAAADKYRADATGVHHGLRALVALLNRDGNHGSCGGSGLERNSDALGSLRAYVG